MESSTLDNVRMLQTLVSYYFKNNELDLAYKTCETILELEPDNLDCLLLRSRIWLAWKSYNDALEDCNSVISKSR